jgi:hypothetical protein
VTEAFEDVVKYMVQILDFVEEILEVIEEFFVSAFRDIKEVISSLNPKETVEGFGKTLQGFRSDLYNWMKDFLS